jgi:hypothetical protein
MKLFLYEYATALPHLHFPDSIRREGGAMFAALHTDALALDDVEVLTMEAYSLPEEKTQLQRLAAQADWSLIVAPETDGVLLERCQWVQAAGGRFLGPTTEAIRLTGDKWETFLRWKEKGVRTPETWLMHPGYAGRYIRKRRDGAGSLDMLQVTSAMPSDPLFLWQEFIPGQAVSVAFLIDGQGKFLPLLPTAQHLSQDGTFRYLGGTLPLEPALTQRTLPLATQAVAAIPGLLGFVGVDLVLGDDPTGKADYAIEINPRFTTSYVGLRAMVKQNLVGMLLQMAEGKPVPPLGWKPGSVTFDAQGQVRLHP